MSDFRKFTGIQLSMACYYCYRHGSQDVGPFCEPPVHPRFTSMSLSMSIGTQGNENTFLPLNVTESGALVGAIMMHLLQNVMARDSSSARQVFHILIKFCQWR